MTKGDFCIVGKDINGTYGVSKVTGWINQKTGVGLHCLENIFDYGWRVTDLNSGTIVARGWTKAQAYAEYKKLLDNGKLQAERDKPRYAKLCERMNNLLQEE